MIITPDYCRMMARYNAWQNDGLRGIVGEMPEAALRQDRGAFFGSVLGTLNHILWADRMWLSRLAGDPAPAGGLTDSTGLAVTGADWAARRFRTDRRLTVWAEGLRAMDLVGDLDWMSGATGGRVQKPRAQLVVHLFNHQTHHRGQVHAMLTAAGIVPDATDLAFMPD